MRWKSHDHGSASTVPASNQSVTRSATETVVQLPVETCVAGCHAIVESSDGLDRRGANAALNGEASSAVGALSQSSEGQTSQRNVNADSSREELAVGAGQNGHASALTVESVVGGAVEAGAVVGIVVIATQGKGQTFVLISIQIIAIFAFHDVSLNLTVTINSSQPSIIANSAKTVGLIDDTFVDSSEADISSEGDLELVAAVRVESGGDDGSIIEYNSGDDDGGVGGDVGAVDDGGGGTVDGDEDGGDAFDNFVDGAGNAGVVYQDVGEPAFETSGSVEGTTWTVADFFRTSHAFAIFQYEAALAGLAGDVAETNRTAEIDEGAWTTVVLAPGRDQEEVTGAWGTSCGVFAGGAWSGAGLAESIGVPVLASGAGLGGQENREGG